MYYSYSLDSWNGGIYTSTNSGFEWTQTSAGNRYWTAIASSADGTKLAAAWMGDGIYRSTDSGASWTQTSAPRANWYRIASSADGTKLAAGTWAGGIYISTDSGLMWTQTSAPTANWQCIACSADGTKLAAVVAGVGIWTAQATILAARPPRLAVTKSGSGATVSWPYPSTGWALQQNSNLSTTNWTCSGFTVTTNASDCSLTIPAAAGSLFFRLANGGY